MLHDRRGRGDTAPHDAGGGEAALPVAGDRHRRRTTTESGFTLLEAAYGVATGQIAALYDLGGAVVGSGIVRATAG